MSSQRLVRLKAEMTMMSKSPVPGIHCWLKDTESDVVMVEMDGPEGSPYQNGVFRLEVTLSDRYPFTPPNIKFLTPVYHPNIDPNGRICLTALKPKPTGTWTVTLNLATVLSAIRILLAEPNLADPLMTDIAKEYAENYESYQQRAKSDTLKHAKKAGPSSSSGKKLDSSSKVCSTSIEADGKENSPKISSQECNSGSSSKKPRLN